MTDTIDRRQLLKSIGATGTLAVSLSLAGCTAPTNTGGDGSGDGGSDGDGNTETTTASDGGSGGDGGTQTNTVEMTDDLKFEPADIQISAGTTVTWENVGSIGHTVTAYEDKLPDGAEYFAAGGYDSEQAARDGYPGDGNVGEGGTYEHTFDSKGTYEYFCIPHEMNGMVGTIEVV